MSTTGPDWKKRLTDHGLDEIRRLAEARALEPRAKSFLFMRHGQTEGNAKRIFQPADIPLNQRGLEQAREAAQWVREHAPERIVASDMLRAWQSAEVIAQSCGARPQAEPRLRERWFGDWVGTPSARFDWRDQPPNGERLADFVARTRVGLGEVLEEETPTLVVAHGGTLYVLVYSLGVELLESHITNATPLAFERAAGGWTVRPLAPAAVDDFSPPS